MLIDTTDANWGFELRPTLERSSMRTWWFRAGNEDDRLEWAQQLVADTFRNHSSSRRSAVQVH